MLRERRRVLNQNIKPNRRLDKKSSRGMVFENEELRLRTINISADVERGQSDIRKLRRENELLRREIWTLRDEYDRLDKLLQDHRPVKDDCGNISLVKFDENASHSHHHHHQQHQHQLHQPQCDLSDSDVTTCDDDSESSSDSISNCTVIENQPTPEVQLSEIFDNLDNEQITDSSSNFETLSVVLEENISTSTEQLEIEDIKTPNIEDIKQINWTENQLQNLEPIKLLVPKRCHKIEALQNQSFQKGGNLEDLLFDIQNLSRDIHSLQMLNNSKLDHNDEFDSNRPDILASSVSLGSTVEHKDGYQNDGKKPFRSEINLILTQPDKHSTSEYAQKTQSLSQTPIGFESFNLESITEPLLQLSENVEIIEENINQKIAANNVTKNSEFVRKQFQKGPSFSLNEIQTHQTKSEHSKFKRLSLDIPITDSAEMRLNETNINDGSNSSNNIHNSSQQISSAKQIFNTKVNKRKPSRQVSMFFKRKDKTKSKAKDDEDDEFYNYNAMNNKFNQTFSFRGTNKQQKQALKMKTKPNKVQQKQQQTQQYLRSVSDSKGSGMTNSGNRRTPRMSIGGSFLMNEINDDDSDDIKSIRNSKNLDGDDGAEIDSSRETSADSFRSRKLSIASFSKREEKIPWCGCWGNGCF